MIYMIEGILPECYFNNNMRGLSIDMAVFRDLLKLRLPRLSKHLDNLQFSETKEGSKGNQNYCFGIRWKNLKIFDSPLWWKTVKECYFFAGTSFEPPLTNVFTMQWFLTLFSTCLPRDTVLRVWDLILLEGNEILLRTALAIWKGLEE